MTSPALRDNPAVDDYCIITICCARIVDRRINTEEMVIALTVMSLTMMPNHQDNELVSIGKAQNDGQANTQAGLQYLHESVQHLVHLIQSSLLQVQMLGQDL